MKRVLCPTKGTDTLSWASKTELCCAGLIASSCSYRRSRPKVASNPTPSATMKVVITDEADLYLQYDPANSCHALLPDPRHPPPAHRLLTRLHYFTPGCNIGAAITEMFAPVFTIAMPPTPPMRAITRLWTGLAVSRGNAGFSGTASIPANFCGAMLLPDLCTLGIRAGCKVGLLRLTGAR